MAYDEESKVVKFVKSIASPAKVILNPLTLNVTKWSHDMLQNCYCMCVAINADLCWTKYVSYILFHFTKLSSPSVN